MKSARFFILLAMTFAPAEVVCGASASSTEDLVLHATFDNDSMDGTTVHDTTAPAEDGTIKDNAVGGGAGLVGEAMTFSGGHIDFGNVHDPGAGGYSVCFWFRSPDISRESSVGFMVAKGNTKSSLHGGFSVFVNGGRMVVRAKASSPRGQDEGRIGRHRNGELKNDTWYHIAMVIERDTDANVTRMRSYLNGQESGWAAGGGGAKSDTCTDAAAVIKADPSEPPSLILGSRPDGSRAFHGDMDELGIWNRALNRGEVRAIYEAGREGRSFSQIAPAGGNGAEASRD